MTPRKETRMLTVTRSREYLTDSFVGTHEGCGIFIPANRMLYQFVSDNPSNTDRDQIASKALIIGRSLAASAERRTIKGERLSSADFFHGLADAISKSGLEEVLDFLPQDGTISRSTSTEVHKAHAFLCSAITARTALKWVAEEEGWVFAFTTSRSAKNYPEYVRIYLNAKDVFEADLGRPLSLRQMDNILLNRYDNYI
ncbi:hypothetical protein WR25_08775 [Diploscapter pachys]|uniref:Uncharacterized protein n=1 Tax=Diploscapter pachys TaxID=2018661 RepID=A0A2A2JWE7_9BILA|nr:hypothetical protein WR25_08775 [Diploscapter pachys]